VKKSDPFEGPHDGSDLFLGKVGQNEGGEVMVGLLNKFSIVDEHFLLVTEGSSILSLVLSLRNQLCVRAKEFPARDLREALDCSVPSMRALPFGDRCRFIT
jgi:hypothetical protein